jgi:HK97 family phage major capsid protein
MDNIEELTTQVEQLTTQLKAALAVMEEAKAEDGGRWQTANDERIRLAKELGEVKGKIEARERSEATDKAVAEVNAFLSTVRAPSKADLIGFGRDLRQMPAHKPGQLILGIAMRTARDWEIQQAGKAILEDIGVSYQKAWGEGIGEKATLGLTDATGGWIIPNAIVDDLIKPALYKHPYRQICTVVPGVTAAAVDIPWRSSTPSKALVVAWGSEKTNLNLVYNGYTATMYTLAQIYDLSKQFVAKSAGAAEADVMGELAQGFARGEAYYILSGAGTTEPYGLLTALAGIPAYTTAFTAAATLAGSVATAIATAAGALAGREVVPNAAILDSIDYWSMLSQGDAAGSGFFFNPAAGPTAIPGVQPGTLVSPWGIPVYPDSSMVGPALVVGDFKSLKIYLGESYRVDSSDVANTRWDYNLIGFRGEMEMGFDARPAVYSGHFENIADVRV